MSEANLLENAPMADDRAAGWGYVRSGGEVYEAGGAWYLTSIEAVQFAHRHPEIFSSSAIQAMMGVPVPMIPLSIDPPNHLRFRKVLDPLFAPRVINKMEDSLRAQVRELIAAFADDGECDIVQQLARLYPTQVFLTMFGMPVEHRDMYLGWVETLVGAAAISGPTDEMMNAGLELFRYLGAFIEQKRANPGDDLLSQIMAIDGDEAWTTDEILGMCFLFTLAGLDTVTAAIGFTLYHLARDPGLRQRLLDDPALIAPTIEEILRLESVAPNTPRITTQDVEVCGVTIPAGQIVMVCLGSGANYDEARFVDAPAINIESSDRGHLAFGGGIHRCLGSHLARRELRLVVEEFHRVIPEYAIAPDARPQVVWPSGTLHLKDLPLVFPKAGA